MVIRQRAIQTEDKQERHDAILDALERLLSRSPDRVANVAEVADEAGLAKGTVYLYFPGKEEMLLALHERNIDAFFTAVIAMVEDDAPLERGMQAMQELTHRHVVEPPLFLPLAARCFGLMAHNISPEAAVAFKQRMAQRLERAGAGFERHFPQLRPGDGVALLRRSYALIIGLWLMSGAGHEGPSLCPSTQLEQVSSVFAWSYGEELDRALTALWNGMLTQASTS